MIHPATWLVLIVLWLLVGGGLAFTVSGPLGVLFLLVLTAGVVRCILAYRGAVHAHVVSVLASAVRQTLPLPEALFLEAGRRTDLRSIILRRTADCLMVGMRLHEALRQGWPYCPGGTVAMLEAAEELNQLPQALEILEADLEQKRQDQFRLRVGYPLYPMTVFLMTLGVATSFSFLFLPKVKDIFGGIGVRPPAVTQWVLGGLPVFLLILGPLAWVLLLVGGGAYVYSLFRPRWPWDPKFLSVVGDWVKWHLPAWRWFERNASLLQTVEAIRLSLRAGAPVDLAVARAAEMDTNLCYRKRLRRWLAAIQSGRDVAESARSCRVGGGLAWAMNARLNPSGSLEVLEAMERLYRSNYKYSVALLRTILWPCLILGIGALVAVLAVAIILPMAALIRAMEVLP